MYYSEDNIETIITKINAIQNYMVQQHNKVLTIRFDVRFPYGYQHDGSNNQISKLIKLLKTDIEPSVGTILYAWAREQVNSPVPHYHVALWVNGSVMQNPYGLLKQVDAIWNSILGGSHQGLIHLCGKSCMGETTTGSIMIRRPSSVATGTVLAEQQQAFETDYAQAMYRASYLAKSFSKDLTPPGVRRFGGSQGLGI